MLMLFAIISMIKVMKKALSSEERAFVVAQKAQKWLFYVFKLFDVAAVAFGRSSRTFIAMFARGIE
jgi:hypothetical protein